MKKPSQIEVEPLSAERWSKIESALMSRAALEANDSTRRAPTTRRHVSGRAWLVAAALVGTLGGAFVFVRILPERAVVEQPSRITTGATASHLALPGLSLDVEPQSAVVVGAETPQGLLIVLDRGSVTCEVAPRSSNGPLVVQAGATRVRVMGTRFTVTRLGESARVRVQRGIVEVSTGGQAFRVGAGEEWPAEVARSAHAGFGEVPSSAQPEHAPSVSSEATPPPRSASTPVAPRSVPDSRSTTAAVSAPPSESPGGRQAVFEQATGLERGDPARASELYATLESGGDAWAQNALYAHGRLEASRGNRDAARRLLERYLERFPRGGNAEDARAVLLRLR